MNGGKWGGRKTSARVTAKKEKQIQKREDRKNKVLWCMICESQAPCDCGYLNAPESRAASKGDE